MTQKGCPVCRDTRDYNKARDTAYKLLLAYAECMEAMKYSWGMAKPVFVKHGYKSSGAPSDFILSLRTRGLEAAKEAG